MRVQILIGAAITVLTITLTGCVAAGQEPALPGAPTATQPVAVPGAVAITGDLAARRRSPQSLAALPQRTVPVTYSSGTGDTSEDGRTAASNAAGSATATRPQRNAAVLTATATPLSRIAHSMASALMGSAPA